MRQCIWGSTFVIALCVFSLFNFVEAQTKPQIANATTDPYEARVLNSIFREWSIAADQNHWNISGELCSGNAIDSITLFDDFIYNPFIKCDCSYNNGTTCHITALKVGMDVVGEIPSELWTLVYLTNLNLEKNYLTGSLPPAIGNLTRLIVLSIGINALSGELPKELGDLTQLIVLFPTITLGLGEILLFPLLPLTSALSGFPPFFWLSILGFDISSCYSPWGLSVPSFKQIQTGMENTDFPVTPGLPESFSFAKGKYLGMSSI
ncbi:hypothetical protein P8452_74861 [Trifolium repens]|nr:hypothetical protein P8452_74861 [Trifolium repens]